MKILVVARYKEDTSWITKIRTPCLVYNKYENSGYVLPNLGREANTYLYHIITNYDDLPSITIFCQGDPMAHCPNFVNEVNDLSEIGLEFKPFGSAPVVDHPIGIHGPTALGIRTGMHFHRIFGFSGPETYAFVPGAQFAVSRARIQQRPLSFYIALYKTTLDASPTYEMGHVLERLWPYVFGLADEK